MRVNVSQEKDVIEVKNPFPNDGLQKRLYEKILPACFLSGAVLAGVALLFGRDSQTFCAAGLAV